MVEPIRWGVLGVANIAKRAVIPAIQRSRNGRLVAIASRTRSRAEEAARDLEIRGHGSYEALLDDPEIQAVYIPLPNSLHREWTVRCAEAGKHVLCEKPLAPTPGECEAMIAACRQHRVTLMEAFMYRFHPRTERVARIVRDGGLGEIRLVRAAFTFQVREPRTNIRFRPDLGGGALYDVGCYAINVTRMILGEPEEAFAAGRIGASGVDEQVGGVLRYAEGRLALLDCGLTLPRREEYEVAGSGGLLRVPNAFLPGTADAEIQIARGTEHTTQSVPGAEQYRLMVEHFGDSAASGSPVDFPPEDAVRNARVIVALLASLRSGRPEKVAR
jgi:D-xylose 1-dehydrogenase (NADP+, D-xylono-1,5-lactone-forming)